MKVCFFDTETTDLIRNSAIPLEKQPHILELFMLLVDDETGEELDVFSSLFQYDGQIAPIITKITGITQQTLAGAPKISDKLEEIQTFIGKSERIVAHNASFDKQMIEFAFLRGNTKVVWPPETVCTVEATEHLKGHRLNLTALHTLLFGEAFDGSHRAESDVRATKNCYMALKSKGEI